MTAVRRSFATLGVTAGLGLLLTAFPARPLSGDGPAGRVSDVRVTGGRVQLVFSATGIAVTDKLNPASINVSAGGRTLPADAVVTAASSATTGALPDRRAVLTLDTSGSMNGEGIAAARTAALAYAAGLPADVRLGLLVFADAPRLLVAPTTDREAVAAAINRVTADGDTALYDGVITAVAAMRGAPAGSEKRLVILSDGEDTTSAHPLSDAIGALNGSRVAADVVAFRLPGSRPTLDQLASSSRGRVLPAASVSDLTTAFASAAEAFVQQALVTVDVPRELDGSEVQLQVSMTAGAQSVAAVATVTLRAAVSQPSSDADTATGPDAAPSRTTLWVVVGTAFLALLLISLLGVWLPASISERSQRQDRIADVRRYRVAESVGRVRVSAEAEPAERNVTKATLAAVDRAVRARGKRQGIVDELDRAGLRIRPEEWAVLQFCVVTIAGAAIFLMLDSSVGLLVGGLFGWLGCRFYIHHRTARRMARFAEQLPDVLQLAAGSLRSGFSLSQAIAGVVTEGTEPTASEFARALAEVRLGAELEDALERVADRMRCLDLHLVVMAIRIAREVGGNLAEVLLTTVATMRERAQLKGEIRVLSAEGRLSARILVALPFLMAGYLLAFKPGYLDPLFSTGRGIALVVVGVILLVLGSLWLRKLVKIEV